MHLVPRYEVATVDVMVPVPLSPAIINTSSPIAATNTSTQAKLIAVCSETGGITSYLGPELYL